MIEPLLESGALPHLAKLRDEGVSGPLHSLMPLQSPRIWNSIATGKRPDKHGITSFARVDENESLHLYLGSDRKVHALWNIVSDAGKSVAVINWWNTFPPEKINGVMVSDHVHEHEVKGREEIALASETPTGATIYPEDWEARVTEMLATEEPSLPFPNPFTENTQLPHSTEIMDRLSGYFDDDGFFLRVALEIEAEDQPDVMLVFFPGIDRVSHFLWGMIEPPDLYPKNLRPSPSERKAGIEAFRKYYEYTDAMLGALIERYTPNDLVIVVSDHGFEHGIDLAMLTGVHRSEKAKDGVIFARGAGLPRGEVIDGLSVLDITPTILAWLGLPVAEDMDGRAARFVGDERVARVATHDDKPVERLGSAPSGSDEKILENLRALGYLEEE
jgi:predicted AlkP superfamily phosphohydrolase/phosphomutase